MIKDTVEIDNFLEDTEFEIIQKFSEKLIRENPLGTRNGTVGFPYEKSLVQKMLHEKLSKILMPFKVHRSMILNEIDPWAIHTDWHKDDEDPYCAVLFPVDFSNKPVHTIVFNEKAYDDDWKSTQEPKNHDWSEHELRLLSHISQPTLQLVTMKKIMKWEQKKLIAWNRDLLHCSDNFTNETKTKTALVLFLSFDEKV